MSHEPRTTQDSVGPSPRRGAHGALAVAAILLSASAASGAGGIPGPGASTADRAVSASPAAAHRYGRMPLYFIENRGQLDSSVAFTVRGRQTSLDFGASGMTIVRTSRRREAGLEDASLPRGVRSSIPSTTSTVRLEFLGANPRPAVRPADPTSAVVSYFEGPRESWKTGLPTYGSIVYEDLWPGIDLVYSGTSDRLESTFVVRPGADPSRIRLAYRGARGIRVNGAGGLEVETASGILLDDAPYAYQETGGGRVPVRSRYSLDRARGDRRAYRFALGPYDRTRPLVIDPALLVYCGYIGGATADEGDSIAVDAAGNAYVAGWTANSEATFPVTVGPDLTFNGSGLFRGDAFVAKVNAAGTALVYCGYIGGNGDDQAYGIAVDGSGNAYVTGYTNSTQATLPVTVGPDLTFNAGTYDAFVAKVDASGTSLDYCGYIGGAGPDYGYAIAVDGNGSAYVTGQTGSNQTSFPVAVGPDLTFNGFADAFVAKVKSDGTGFDYCGYIGGAFPDYGYGIAVDGDGNAYVTGFAQSDETSFPVTVGPGLTYNGGTYDAFVAKVHAGGASLDYCGYIGGSGDDQGLAIAVDVSGHAYVTGYTASSEATFPVAVGPDLTWNGSEDAFVAKVKADGTGFDYCGYIGGDGAEQGTGIAVDADGVAYVAGYTTSTEATFPVTVGPDLTFNGSPSNQDPFVASVAASGASLLYCGYVGGGGRALSIALDGYANAYITGYTLSAQDAFPVTIGPDLTWNGGQDAFVAKIGTPPAIPQSLSVDAHPAGSGSSNVNGVLEPGETVELDPSWQNTLSTAQPVTGTATNLSGPAGPSYTLADGSANYGAVGAGATADCNGATGDCYAVTVAGARPAPHWDATLRETVSEGATTVWTLHVGASFGDVATGNPFYRYVETVFHNGVTAGCGAGVYCPSNAVTRAQMAVFLLKAEHGATYVPPACAGVFADVPCPGGFAVDWIERLAAEGITGGCGGGNYCPNNPVTRAQMAVFLLKGEHGSGYTPPACAGAFTDVPCPGGFAVDWIEALAAEGVTGGCGGGNYCPNSPVTRGQMAVFLTKAFLLTLYGP